MSSLGFDKQIYLFSWLFPREKDKESIFSGTGIADVIYRDQSVFLFEGQGQTGGRE